MTKSASEFDYLLYKFKQNSSSGSCNFNDYENIDLGYSSTSVVSFKGNLKERNIQRSLCEEFEEVLQFVPQNELKTLPSDAASEVDHYIYGTSKRKK